MGFLFSPFFNIIQLGVGFLLVFSAFNSQGFIEELAVKAYRNDTRHCSKNSTDNCTYSVSADAGFNSLCIIYAVFTFANFVAAPIVNLIGSKYAMAIGAACYATFLVTFTIFREWLLYITSAILGFGASIIWTGQGRYLTLNSTEDTIGRNSGVLWALLQTGLLVGGIFLFVTFGSETTPDIEIEQVHIAYVVFLVTTSVGIVLLLLLRTPKRNEDSDVLVDGPSIEVPASHQNNVVGSAAVSTPNSESNWQRWLNDLRATFRMALTPRMCALAFVFVYTGVETTFWTGVYSTCLGQTLGFGKYKNRLLAYNSMLLGAGEITGGGLFGILAHRTNVYGRNPIIMLGAFTHFIAFFLTFLNIPATATLPVDTSSAAYIEPNTAVALITSYLLGFADSCWNTQIYSLLGTLYPDDDSSSAFALFKFYQSGAACIAFLYAGHLHLHWQLLILVLMCFFAAMIFFPVEWQAQMRPSNLAPH